MTSLNTPVARLIGRALVAFVGTLAAQLQASTSWDSSLLRSAIVGAVLAALEVFTPLNNVVGPQKAPEPSNAGGTDPA